MVVLAPITGLRSGVLSRFTGVGTATMKNLASSSAASSEVKRMPLFRTVSPPTSLVGSTPD